MNHVPFLENGTFLYKKTELKKISSVLDVGIDLSSQAVTSQVFSA